MGSVWRPHRPECTQELKLLINRQIGQYLFLVEMLWMADHLLSKNAFFPPPANLITLGGIVSFAFHQQFLNLSYQESYGPVIAGQRAGQPFGIRL